MKSPKSGTRHHSGQPCAPRRMHIFPHFSEFLLIFHRRSLSTEKPTPCVCEVFEQNPIWRRRVSGLVRRGPIRLLKIAFDSPARAEYDAHFFIFLRFLFIFAKSSGCQPTRCGVDAKWVGCLEVENKKSPKTGTRHYPGQPSALRRMHIFPHFSEFLLIFQHGSMSTEKPTPCVCVCEVFEKTQCGGDGWKERRVAGCEVVQLGC